MISGAHDDGMARGPVWNLSALFSLVCSSGPFGVGGSLECQQRIRRCQIWVNGARHITNCTRRSVRNGTHGGSDETKRLNVYARLDFLNSRKQLSYEFN